MSDHVIAYDTIPADIRGAYEILKTVGAISIRAADTGYWCLRLKPGTNCVMLEMTLRAAGCPAFAGKSDLLTVRAIKPDEIALFDADDQAVLRKVTPSDAGSAMERIIEGLSP